MSSAHDLGPLDKLEICPECQSVCGPCAPVSLQGQVVVQDCDCERQARPARSEEQRQAERWGNRDFNIAVELCHCCGLVPLLSGSRWSVWLCNECAGRAQALNQRIGRPVVPIGRHSVMHGISLPVTAREDDEEAVEEFCAASNGLFASMRRLEEWAQERIAYNIYRLGFDLGAPVRLTEYLARIAETSDPDLTAEATFRSLLRRLRVSDRAEAS